MIRPFCRVTILGAQTRIVTCHRDVDLPACHARIIAGRATVGPAPMSSLLQRNSWLTGPTLARVLAGPVMTRGKGEAAIRIRTA